MSGSELAAGPLTRKQKASHTATAMRIWAREFINGHLSVPHSQGQDPEHRLVAILQRNPSKLDGFSETSQDFSAASLGRCDVDVTEVLSPELRAIQSGAVQTMPRCGRRSWFSRARSSRAHAAHSAGAARGGSIQPRMGLCSAAQGWPTRRPTLGTQPSILEPSMGSAAQSFQDCGVSSYIDPGLPTKVGNPGLCCTTLSA